ncbi:CG10031, partial [Drosophila busckii]
QISKLTQFLCLVSIFLLCLGQLTHAVVTTAKPKALTQPQLTTASSSTARANSPTSSTTTTAKPKQKSQDAKCLQPLETGPCRMSLERYYYNKDKNACETFKYGGCRGNDNRWGFKQTCEEACLVKK